MASSSVSAESSSFPASRTISPVVSLRASRPWPSYQTQDMTADGLCDDRPYTTFGPTNDMNLFPSISAPGSSILSTVPGGLGIMRGTSMATPLVCESNLPFIRCFDFRSKRVSHDHSRSSRAHP
jgi:subtilisin family serine protease